MLSETKCGETVLTGSLVDQSALFGVLAQVEALGLDLLEVQKVRASAAGQDGRADSTR
jgi:hypothetical protein